MNAATGKCVGGVSEEDDLEQLLRFFNVGPAATNAALNEIPAALLEIVKHWTYDTETLAKLGRTLEIIAEKPEQVLAALAYDVEHFKPADRMQTHERAILRKLIASATRLHKLHKEFSAWVVATGILRADISEMDKFVEMMQLQIIGSKGSMELVQIAKALEPLDGTFYDGALLSPKFLFLARAQRMFLNGGKIVQVLPEAYEVTGRLLRSYVRSERTFTQKLNPAMEKLMAAVDEQVAPKLREMIQRKTFSLYGLRLGPAHHALKRYMRSPEGIAMAKDLGSQFKDLAAKVTIPRGNWAWWA